MLKRFSQNIGSCEKKQQHMRLFFHPTVKKSQGSFYVTGSHAQSSPAYSER